MKRIIGLDVGEKTIGVAVSDPLGLTAQGITTIKRKDKNSDINTLKAYCEEYKVQQIVVGLPRNMDGSYGKSAEKIRKFAKIIEEKLNFPVRFWDERLSTVSAEKTLLEADVSRKKRRDVIDKIAAVIILQNYLDFSH